MTNRDIRTMMHYSDGDTMYMAGGLKIQRDGIR